MHTRIASILWSTVAGFTFICTGTSTAIDEPRSTTEQRLSNTVEKQAETEYPKAAGSGRLVLLRQELPVPEMIDALLNRARPNGVGNTAYLLVDVSQRDPLSGNVILVSYVTQAAANGPRPETWAVSVVWNHERGEVAIVVARAQDVRVWVSLYTAKPDKTIHQYPLQFDLSDAANWPPASKPLATFEKLVVADRYCAIARLSLSAVGNAIATQITFVDPACPPLSIDYALDRNRWSVPAPLPEHGE
jgi:hypothetical protein